MRLNRLIRRNRDDGERLVVQPPVDITETENAVVIELDMPGVQKDALSVELCGDQLVVRGVRKKDKIEEEYTSIYQERYADLEYRRTFELNTDVDKENISANYQNGVLKITLAKAKEAQPQKIEIST